MYALASILTLPGDGPGVNCILYHLFHGEPIWFVISKSFKPPQLEIVGEPTRVRTLPSDPALTVTDPAGRVSSVIPPIVA